MRADAPGARGELEAVTAQLAELTTALTGALTALATAGHSTTPTPTPATGAAPAPAPAAPSEPPSSAVVPAPARRDTWRCARHLAAPDPLDRPCGGCGAVRKRMQAHEAQQATEAAQSVFGNSSGLRVSCVSAGGWRGIHGRCGG